MWNGLPEWLQKELTIERCLTGATGTGQSHVFIGSWNRHGEAPRRVVVKIYKTKSSEPSRLRPVREKLALERLQQITLPTSQELDSSFTTASVPTILATNITTLQETSKLQESIYLITNYINTQTLQHFMNGSSNGVDLMRGMQFLRQLLEILDVCHKAGISHRDIKPNNIILCADNELDKAYSY